MHQSRCVPLWEHFPFRNSSPQASAQLPGPMCNGLSSLLQRCKTLLKEYKERDKSNVFVDKRFGEYNSNISLEEKMLKRFTLEQQRQHEKKNIYNLNEDEELTHYGQSLADIEKHNDIVDSDSDTEERGTLSAELTAAHFGGGGPLNQKPAPQPGEDGERARSRKELIEELIAKSKQEKVRWSRRRHGPGCSRTFFPCTCPGRVGPFL